MITLSHAAAISKAKIGTLREDFKHRVEKWFGECVERGIVPYIYEGFRTLARQVELYAKGRTTPGAPCKHNGITRQIGTCPKHPMGLTVTDAEPGQSFHNAGLAFDWVPLKRVEKAEGMYEADWKNEPFYAVGADIGKDFNFRALSWETPHLQDAIYNSWHNIPKELFNK